MGGKDFGSWVCSKLGLLCILGKSLALLGCLSATAEHRNHLRNFFSPPLLAPPKPTGQAALGSPGLSQQLSEPMATALRRQVLPALPLVSDALICSHRGASGRKKSSHSLPSEDMSLRADPQASSLTRVS